MNERSYPQPSEITGSPAAVRTDAFELGEWRRAGPKDQVREVIRDICTNPKGKSEEFVGYQDRFGGSLSDTWELWST